mgnify:CR=1 FL=1
MSLNKEQIIHIRPRFHLQVDLSVNDVEQRIKEMILDPRRTHFLATAVSNTVLGSLTF